jgi:1,4-dihydroxy-2-naphthoate octaprenyltransferase
MNNRMQLILGPMRLPFLILAPVCVFLGLAAAVYIHGPVSPLAALLAFLGGLGAHISVNALNEYFDFKSGLDFKTQRTPFSGGSGTLPNNPQGARTALATGLISLAITAAIGVYFSFTAGLALLPLGLAGLFIVFFYTIWLTRVPFLSLLAPGLGFGTLMVMGTAFVLGLQYSWAAFFASLVPFFLVSNLLLLNQFPDAEADQTIGRRHYPIAIGRKASAVIYVLFLAGTYLAIIAGVVLNFMPIYTLLGLLTLVIAIPTALNVLKNPDEIAKLIPSLGMNVILNLLTPVLVGVGFLLGR